MVVEDQFVGHRGVEDVTGGAVLHALRLAGAAGRVQDEQRVLRIHRLGFAGRRLSRDEVVVPDVAALGPVDVATGTAHDEDGLDVRTVGQRRVGVALEGDDAAAADALVGGDHGAAVRVQDAVLERLRGKAAEHHGVGRADAGAREHRVGGLRDHRHVDAHAVALAYAAAPERVGEAADRVVQFAVRDGRVVRGVVAFPHDGRLVGPRGQVPVDAVGAGVQSSPEEPRDPARGQVPLGHGVPLGHPVEATPRLLRPEGVRIVDRAAVQRPVGLAVEVRPLLHGAGDGVHGRHVLASRGIRHKLCRNRVARQLSPAPSAPTGRRGDRP